MANKLPVDLKDTAELQNEMCMNSLKRALDDVEYNDYAAEPLKKRTCLPVSRRFIRVNISGKKAKVGARTHCRLQSNKKYFQTAPPKHPLNAFSSITASQGSDFEHKTDKSDDLDIKKKRSKRSADSQPNQTTEESDTKKRKVEQTVTETETENGQDTSKPVNELNTTDSTCETPQHTESPKLVTRLCGIPEYMREGNKDYNLQQDYNFRKNVAFARKVLVYSSDGSEYDYDHSDADNGICGDDDGDLYDDDGDLYDDDDGDLYDDDEEYEDAEVVSKRLNLQIADFFKLHRNNEPSVLKNVTNPQSGDAQPTDLLQTSSFGMSLFHKQNIFNTYRDPSSAGGSGAAAAAAVAAAAVAVAAAAAATSAPPPRPPPPPPPLPSAAAGAAGGFEHDENGNDSEEFDRAGAVSNNLKHGVPW